MYGYINSFNVISSHDFFEERKKQIIKEIQNKGKEYIIGVDENEFKEYLINKYTLNQIVIDLEKYEVDKPTKSKETVEDRYRGGKYERDVYTFEVSFNFTGSSEIFKIHPSTWIMKSGKIYVSDNTVKIYFKMHQLDASIFHSKLASEQNDAFINLSNANKDALIWNNKMHAFINSQFSLIKSNYISENNFFAEIKAKVNQDTKSIFTAPTIKKKIIPQPALPKGVAYSSEPTMAKEMYVDALKVIYDFGKNAEKKPSLYKGKEEEDIRDLFVAILESRYDATATGETFNKDGKTDILLKYKDGTNLFVAECKVWHGTSEFLKAISQLFDRYLTWRDSKVALIMFVNNKDFSNVLKSIETEIKKHPYFIKFIGKRGETSYSYIFRLPHDSEKPVELEVMAFHYFQ